MLPIDKVKEIFAQNIMRFCDQYNAISEATSHCWIPHNQPVGIAGIRSFVTQLHVFSKQTAAFYLEITAVFSIQSDI